MSEGFWNEEGIAKTQRERWNEATAGWTAEQLREKLIEVAAAAYPINYVLSHLNNNPAGPHGGMNVISDIFPETFGRDTPDGLEEDRWCLAWDKDAKEYKAKALVWTEPPPDRMATQERYFDAGQTLHPKFAVLSIWQYAMAASINCGSFGAHEIRRLTEALALPPALTRQDSKP